MKKKLFACYLFAVLGCSISAASISAFSQRGIPLNASSLKTITFTSFGEENIAKIRYQYEGYQGIDLNVQNPNGDGSYINVYTFTADNSSCTFGEDYIFEAKQDKYNYKAQYGILIYVNNIVSVSWVYETMAFDSTFLFFDPAKQSQGERVTATTSDLVGSYTLETEACKLSISGSLGYSTGAKTKLVSLSITYDSSKCIN